MVLAREPLKPSPSRLQRLVSRWWRQQSPSRQDRFATIGPLVSVLLFLAAITAAFWYLRNEEIDRATDALRRDTEVAQQQIRLHLIENQEQLVRIAREVVTRDIDTPEFLGQAGAFQRGAVDLGFAVAATPDQVGHQADDGVTPARFAPLDGFEQKARAIFQRKLQHGGDGGLEVADAFGVDHLCLASRSIADEFLAARVEGEDGHYSLAAGCAVVSPGFTFTG